jgi:photosynthetic reaction center cytochrome c subunit
MKIRATLLALTFGVLSCVPLAMGQEGPPKKAKMDPNKPAGEQFKNVQLLKEVPSGEFIAYMRAFNASLGVECGFCHAQDRSSDEKHEKVVARKMIAMTQDINAKNFNGKMEVKCFTCHRGAEHPVSQAPGGAAPSAEKKN